MTAHWVESLLLGESPAMQRLKALILRVGPAQLPVLIEGPTGSGKELVARALHISSGRRGKLVAFNVCAIPESVFESALFGHVRGAFTGATGDALGYLREAHGGTAFFDEISALPLLLHAKMLRAIETREFRPVGGRCDERSDFRVVAATNDQGTQLVEAGRLREDLFERLAAVVISVPPLRDRVEDIPQLALHFLSTDHPTPCCLTSSALRALQERDWPRNVRQLRNAIARAVAIAPHAAIGRGEIAAALDQIGHSTPPLADSFERRRLLALLDETDWKVPAAALRLGVDRATLYRRLKRHGIDVTTARTGLASGLADPSTAWSRATSQGVAAMGCDGEAPSNSQVVS